MSDHTNKDFLKQLLESLGDMSKKRTILFESEKGISRDTADVVFLENLHVAFGVEEFDLGEVEWQRKDFIQHEQHGGCRQFQRGILRFISYPLQVGIKIYPQMETEETFHWRYEIEYAAHDRWMGSWAEKFKGSLLSFQKDGRLKTDYAPNKCLDDVAWITSLFSSRNDFSGLSNILGDVDLDVRESPNIQDSYRTEVVITFHDFGVKVMLSGVYLTTGWNFEIKQLVFDKKTFRTLKDTPFRFKNEILERMNEGLSVIAASGADKAPTSSELYAYTGFLFEVDGNVSFIKTNELLRQTLSKAFNTKGISIQHMLNRTEYVVTAPNTISPTVTEWVLTFTEGFNQTLTYREVKHRGKKHYLLVAHTK